MLNDSWCSHACIFFLLDDRHDKDCTPIDAPTEAEREAVQDQYKVEFVKAGLSASAARDKTQKTYSRYRSE